MVFSDFTHDQQHLLQTTPLMAPSSKLLVYQILPNSEVAADYLPFDVEADYPQSVTAAFSQQTRPSPATQSTLHQTEGPAKVGLVAVDKSVFILAENRLNLPAGLRRAGAALHGAAGGAARGHLLSTGVTTQGAKEIFDDAGVWC